MRLPEGVIYCKGEPYAFGELSVKGESWTNDFLCLGLQWIEADDSGQATDHLDSMLTTGATFPLQNSYGRDGLFNEKDIFLVYEPSDLRAMVEHFTHALGLPVP